MSIIKYNPQEITFNEQEIMPYSKLGGVIDWNKVFQNKIGLFYPKPINWNNSVNEDGEFDEKKFYLARLGYDKKREEYLGEIDHTMVLLERIEKNKGYEYYVFSYLKEFLKALEKMFFLGENEQGIYEQPFYKNLKLLEEQIQEQTNIPENNDFKSIFIEIRKNIGECLIREKESRNNFMAKLEIIRTDGIKQYVKDDDSLDVDKVLQVLNAHWARNEEYMLMAFYKAKCNKADLERLQAGAIEALNSKIQRLDTYKVFIILERVLPFINQGFKINRDLPEIFRPEYLNKINIYDLDIDRFTAQVKSKGVEYKRPQEIQEKLIEQFKQFGSSKSGVIGFGQGSEQLRYRNGVTSGVNENNFKHYLKEPNLGEEKRPVPNILITELPNQKENLMKALT